MMRMDLRHPETMEIMRVSSLPNQAGRAQSTSNPTPQVMESRMTPLAMIMELNLWRLEAVRMKAT